MGQAGGQCVGPDHSLIGLQMVIIHQPTYWISGIDYCSGSILCMDFPVNIRPEAGERFCFFPDG